MNYLIGVLRGAATIQSTAIGAADAALGVLWRVRGVRTETEAPICGLDDACYSSS